jgi:two-component system sensor histidine kinase PhoQ
MQDIVQYQLQRASAGQATFMQPLPVADQLEKVLAALDKVYRDKRLEKHADVPDDVQFYGDKGDLLEVLGNLLDNAYKYGRSRIRVTASAVASSQHRRPGLTLEVEDDGPGIADAVRERVLKRGVRADSRVEGQGLGLAVVMDIITAYGGQLDLGRGADGGARVTATFPPS